MNEFWKSDTYRIVQKMKASGNQPGIVEHWKNLVAYWAAQSVSPDAEAVRAFLPHWQTRPLYTAAELAPIFPMLALALGLRQRPEPQKGPARLANELRMASLPHRNIGAQTYFAVAQCHHWRAADDIEWEKEISNAQC